MTRRLISTGSPFEAEIGYSRAVVQGNWCFISGVTGYDYFTMTLPPDLEGQVRNCHATIRAVLAEAGFAASDLIRVTHIVADRADVAAIRPLIGAELGEIRPASTMLIAGLMEPGMRYEVEATAFRGDG